MARNWLKTLRHASFRGVPFLVDADGPISGRRVAVHDISGGEAPVTEDMGIMAREIHVRAYVAGDASDMAGLALEQACQAPGPSLLALPMDPPQLMHCIECRRVRRKEKAGYVAYDLSFVVAGAGIPALGDALSALRGVFAATVKSAASALASVW